MINHLAPSTCASAIINGDYSSLNPSDIGELNTWLALNDLSFKTCINFEYYGLGQFENKLTELGKYTWEI